MVAVKRSFVGRGYPTLLLFSLSLTAILIDGDWQLSQDRPYGCAREKFQLTSSRVPVRGILGMDVPYKLFG
ncbi:hypothetical protein EI94DRAFT_1724703 [Lactarius quietus]|nr:hypothetical protein EI94DRAFT_1724703 [Lactarius quietus]